MKKIVAEYWYFMKPEPKATLRIVKTSFLPVNRRGKRCLALTSRSLQGVRMSRVPFFPRRNACRRKSPVDGNKVVSLEYEMKEYGEAGRNAVKVFERSKEFFGEKSMAVDQNPRYLLG